MKINKSRNLKIKIKNKRTKVKINKTLMLNSLKFSIQIKINVKTKCFLSIKNLSLKMDRYLVMRGSDVELLCAQIIIILI